MSVIDGQPVNAAISNPSWISKNTDDVMPNKLGFSRPLSGTSIADIQAAVNKLYTASGASETQTGTNYNATPSTITNGQNYQTALGILAGKFDPATGHTHSGAPGQGPALMHSLSAFGDPQLTGDVVLVAGAGVLLNQVGQQISISASGGGGGGGGSFVSFPLANGQYSLAPVTGFLVNASVNNGFACDFSILRSASGAYSLGIENTAFYGNLGSAYNDDVFALGVQPNGQIVVGGRFTNFNGNSRNYLCRLNSDGTEDTTFATNIGAGFNDIVYGVCVQSNGQIVVVGQFTSFNGNTRRGVVRLNSDGTEDTAFYGNTGTAFSNQVYSVVEQTNGKLVFGSHSTFNSNGCVGLVRLNPDGTEDTAFTSTLGTGLAGGSGLAEVVALQTNAQIIVGGSFTTLNGSSVAESMVRLNSDGTLDSSFNTNLGSGFSGSLARVYAISVYPSGQIAVGGDFLSFNGNARTVLVRLNSDGTEDSAFYGNLGSLTGVTLASQLQSDSSLVIGGSFATIRGLARILSSGTQDYPFAYNIGTGFDNNVQAVGFNNDLSILVGGDFTNFNGNTRNFLVSLAAGTGTFSKTQVGTFYGAYSPASAAWTISDPIGAFDDVEVTFSMGATGQLFYVDTMMAGSVLTSTFRYLLRGL